MTQVTFPVYVETIPRGGGQAPLFQCRPLFTGTPLVSDENLGRAMGRFAEQIRKQLNELARLPRHDLFAAWTFCPKLITHTLKLHFAVDDRTIRGKLLFVDLEALNRRLIFTPNIPELWFEIARGESLLERANEVIGRHFKDQFRDSQGSHADIPMLRGPAWVTTIDISVTTRQLTEEEHLSRFLRLFDDSRMDGADELRRIGRCLDWDYPDDLGRASRRAKPVAELQRLLSAPDRRPVLLLGPRLSGKTTVLEEVVFRRVAARKKQFADRQNVWLISPQRLISGMSFVGQWENRLLAILQHARKRDHVLYFDDLIGLYQAGVSRDSSLCVADVLKGELQRHSVRILGEATPEQFYALQERDRGFADSFHVISVPETSQANTLRILLATQRQLESAHRCRFALDVLPAVIEIQERYARDAAFPGKAARFLRQIANKRAGQTIDREDVLHEFHAQSGLTLNLLDGRRKLTRKEILGGLQQRMIGQMEALEAATDIIAVAKARLNDPQRPLATLLFLGPTGVGKTQCAKTIAEYLFSDAQRLIRFDMNEFVGAYDAARLVGTFSEPEGLLTSAVRQQPFCVVLLDEIEKAHPDVFDLLLQVTGEGRLTDALGRTTDFRNAIVIMTSNLATAEAARQLGFAGLESSQRQMSVAAAERFFRPEFFNRIDRIIPFHHLQRNDVRRIAELLIQELFRREGLVRRQTVLRVDDRAMERVIDQGFHPQLGARALKRAIEREISHPVAARLAGMVSDGPAVIGIWPQSDGLAVEVQSLEDCEPQVSSKWHQLEPSERLVRATQAMLRIENNCLATKPIGGVTAGAVSVDQLRHFGVLEQVHQVRQHLTKLTEAFQARRRSTRPPMSALTGRMPGKSIMRPEMASSYGRQRLIELFTSDDIRQYIHDLSVPADDDRQLAQRFDDLRDELAWLEAIDRDSAHVHQAVLVIRSWLRHSQRSLNLLVGLYQELLTGPFGCDCVRLSNLPEDHTVFLHVSGVFCWPLMASEIGTLLVVRIDEALVPVQVLPLPVPEESDAVTVATAHIRQRQNWLDALYRSQATVRDDPFPLAPVRRGISAEGSLDLYTGFSTAGLPSLQDWRKFLLAALPLPAELEA